MGQGCAVSKEKEQRIHELENVLSDQEATKEALQQKLDEEKFRHKQLMRDPEINTEEASAQKIEKLTNEKRNIHKQMLKEKKNVTKLEDSIQEYKDKIAAMEAEIKEINDRKRKRAKVKSKIRDLKLPSANSYKPESDGNGDNDGCDSDGYPDSEEMTSSDEEPQVTKKTTMILDVAFSPESEASAIYSWIHDQKISPKNKKAVKQLKHRLASVLTARSELYRQQLVKAYYEKYGVYLENDVTAAIGKGNAMAIIYGLLVTRAEYDSMLINEYIANWDIFSVADILCCRSMEEIQELEEVYKKRIKRSMKKQLQALAQKKKKLTFVKVIGAMFDFNREVPKEVNIAKVNDDLNFVLTTKNFKNETKERLVSIFTTNNVAYIKVFNSQFMLKSKDSLTVFIDKKLGAKSAGAHFCKTRIEYALDTPDYYARKIKKLGAHFNKNKKQIADIFIQRLETDLDVIKRQWVIKKYGDNNQSLAEWIGTKTHGSKYGNFLLKMLENCDRYGAFRKQHHAHNSSKFEKLMM